MGTEWLVSGKAGSEEEEELEIDADRWRGCWTMRIHGDNEKFLKDFKQERDMIIRVCVCV